MIQVKSWKMHSFHCSFILTQIKKKTSIKLKNKHQVRYEIPLHFISLLNQFLFIQQMFKIKINLIIFNKCLMLILTSREYKWEISLNFCVLKPY